MEMLNVNTGEYISRVYIYDASDSSCDDAADQSGLAPQETGEMLRSFPDSPASCHQENVPVQVGIPKKIVLERDSKVDIVMIVMPGVSCDMKLDVTLKGEGAEANIYGAYVCGADERVKIAVEQGRFKRNPRKRGKIFHSVQQMECASRYRAVVRKRLTVLDGDGRARNTVLTVGTVGSLYGIGNQHKLVLFISVCQCNHLGRDVHTVHNQLGIYV